MRSHAQSTFSDTEAEIGEAVDFVVHVDRQPSRRILREVLAIRGYDRDAKRFLIEPVFETQHPESGNIGDSGSTQMKENKYAIA
jgi:pilus assembly protein CpaF